MPTWEKFGFPKTAFSFLKDPTDPYFNWFSCAKSADRFMPNGWGYKNGEQMARFLKCMETKTIGIGALNYAMFIDEDSWVYHIIDDSFVVNNYYLFHFKDNEFILHHRSDTVTVALYGTSALNSAYLCGTSKIERLDI